MQEPNGSTIALSNATVGTLDPAGNEGVQSPATASVSGSVTVGRIAAGRATG
jgi:hypothetical protein